MRLGEYISALQKLEEEYGPDIEVCVYPDDGQMNPNPCGEPRLCYTGPVIVTDTE